MKKLIFAIFLIAAIAILPACSIVILPAHSFDTQENEPQTEPVKKHMIEPGQVFQDGSYIYFENVEFLFNNGMFSIKNNRTDDIIVTMMVVGVKADGTYVILQWLSLGGTDQEQYQKDFEENGWAVPEWTNTVRAGGTLDAEFSIFDYGSDFPAPDIDGDGYYDIIFTIHPQTRDGYITTSTEDPESDIYKLKAY